MAPEPPKKKHNRSLFYRISAWLHLWLGLITGLVVVIVCLTGCIWLFNAELTLLFQPETRVAQLDQPVLPPSGLEAVVHSQFPDAKLNYASYQRGSAVYLGISDSLKGDLTLRVNPYDGHIVRLQEEGKGAEAFFPFILDGHRFLWLPWKIGRPVVNYSILIFVITLVTGMVLWWPKKWNKSTRNKSFKLKWNGTIKRINYDLHNVLGFYALLVLFAVACTGIVYGIEWFSKGLYWTTTGGRTLPEFVRPASDTTQAGKSYTVSQAMNLAWEKVVAEHPDAGGFYYSFPEANRPASAISIYVYPTAGRYYDNRNYVFDQHTLEPLPAYALSSKPFSESDFGDKLRRMNYDIHIGAILGLPGRILVFFATLIGASLPITGFIIWWNKRKKKKKKPKGKAAVKAVQKHPVAPSKKVSRPVRREEPVG